MDDLRRRRGHPLQHVRRDIATSGYAGGLLQRDIGKKLTLGGEFFYHGAEGDATPQTHWSTLLDFGGACCKFCDPGLSIAFLLRTQHRGAKRELRIPGACLDRGQRSEPEKERHGRRTGSAKTGDGYSFSTRCS